VPDGLSSRSRVPPNDQTGKGQQTSIGQLSVRAWLHSPMSADQSLHAAFADVVSLGESTLRGGATAQVDLELTELGFVESVADTSPGLTTTSRPARSIGSLLSLRSCRGALTSTSARSARFE
jgi:hypothetical protein